LANGASLTRQKFGYLIFGIEDTKHTIVGTNFKPKLEKVGGEDLEHWLIKMLSPKIDFRIYEFTIDEMPIVLFEIPAANDNPVRFRHKAYIRIGSYTKELTEYPDKERLIWNKASEKIFETEIAKQNLSVDEIVKMLDIQKYFDLLNLPYPSTRNGIIDKFLHENFITNNGKNRVKILKDHIEYKGYANGFEDAIGYINSQLPSNEEIGKALRKTILMFPELAIRELVANAIIHQDFTETGTGVLVEIFQDRIEITNPGKPLITTLRFIDEYKSRNEKLADCMRRLGICEELGKRYSLLWNLKK